MEASAELPLRRSRRSFRLVVMEPAGDPVPEPKATGALSGEQSLPERTAVRLLLELLAAAFFGVAADRLMSTGAAAAVLPFAVGIALFFGGIFWGRFAQRLGPRFTRTAGEVATDFRWWVLALLVLLLYVGAPGFGRALGMLFSRTHVPAGGPLHGNVSSALSAPAPAAPFDLKIQFNAAGAKPIIISERNMTASISAYKHDDYTGCPQGYANLFPLLNSGLEQNNPGCFVPEHKIQYSYVVVIHFKKPNRYKRIQLDSHGAPLPDWNVLSLDVNSSVLYIHDTVANAVVDVVPAN